MISELDESLLHQTADTFDNTSVSDHRFFDRTVIGVQAPDGRLALITSFGVYKNINVMDGFACIQEDAKRQFNHRFSRRLRPDVGQLKLGPLAIEVVEPLKRLRVRLAPGDYAGSFDLEWKAALPPHEEPRHLSFSNGRIANNYLRFDQFATCSGWIELEGRRTELKDWFAWRDHSWGVRPGIGGFEPVNDHANAIPGMLGLYCWWLTEDDGGLLQLQEDHAGKRLYMDGHIAFRHSDRPPLKVVDIQHDMKILPGTRLFESGRIVATTSDGEEWVIEAESVGRAWLYKGSGYDNGYKDEKGLGVWRGDWLEEYDMYDLSDPEACVLPDGRVIRPMHREQIARVRVNGRPGYAHLPFVSMGRIERYGFGV
jgi:hypothetical protein